MNVPIEVFKGWFLFLIVSGRQRVIQIIIVILYKKDLFDNTEGSLNYEKIEGLTVSEITEKE